MVRRRAHSQDASEGGNGPQAQEQPGEQRDGEQASQPASPAVARAEEMVDRMADRLGHYASVVGNKLLWLAARAREEADDIWAEAQAIRRGRQQ